MSIEWGPEIPTNGVRPAWLAYDDTIDAKTAGGWRYPDGETVGRDVEWAWSVVTSIRLPADHWVYPVIAQGYEPWAGGDEPPKDWDGGSVLTDGVYTICPAHEITDWKTRDKGFAIVGYKKRTEPTEQPTDDSDYVRVKRMTEKELEEAFAEWDGFEFSFSWLARKCGFFKEADTSPAERFKSAHPEWSDIPDEAIMAAMEWEDK